jgi:hypothetical protein
VRTFIVAIAVSLLAAPRPALAWDGATPAWCGSTVAAATLDSVVVAGLHGTRSIAVGGAPARLAFDRSCSRLAAVTDHVLSVDVASGTVVDLGAIPASLVVIRRPAWEAFDVLEWAPSGRRLGVAFSDSKRRGADAVAIYDPTTRTSARLVLPAGEITGFELEADDRATVALRVGDISGPVSMLEATPYGWRALTSNVYESISIAGHAAVAEARGGRIVAVDLATGAERTLVARGALLHGISPDGSTAIVSSPPWARVMSVSLRSGATTVFGLEPGVLSWSADAAIGLGQPRVRAGIAAADHVLFADDGHAAPWIVYDAGASSWTCCASVSPDGSRAAFIRVTRLATHALAGCGDTSWDERNELVVVPIARARAGPATITFLARTAVCVWHR